MRQPPTEAGVPIYIPPHTPIIPGSPWYIYDDPQHGLIDVFDYINGWCLILWIIRTDPGAGGSPLADGLPDNERLMSPPSQDIVNKMAAQMNDANTILWQCKVAFRICEVIVLDARRMKKDGNTLQDRFQGGKASTKSGASFNEDLRKALKDWSPIDERRAETAWLSDRVRFELDEKLRKKCAHLFLVERLYDPDDPTERVHGYGGAAHLGADDGTHELAVPMSVIESGGATQDRTIAHELGHGLGLPHSDEDTGHDDARNDPNNLMKREAGTGLQPSQCERMLKALEKLSAACP